MTNNQSNKENKVLKQMLTKELKFINPNLDLKLPLTLCEKTFLHTNYLSALSTTNMGGSLKNKESLTFFEKLSSNLSDDVFLTDYVKKLLTKDILRKFRGLDLYASQTNLNIEKKNFLLNNVIPTFKTFYIRSRIRRFAKQKRTFKDKRTGFIKKWRSPSRYLKRSQRYNKSRKWYIKRIRKVHWYIPSYIHFDARSLRSVLLHNPAPQEVVFSFKCSLRKVHSFYKGLGL